MSFSEKIASMMARPGQDPADKDDVPWWMRYAGRGLGTVGGFFAIFLGIWNIIFIVFGNTDSMLSGLFQMVAGFVLLCCEAPCCCMFIDYVQNISEVADKRPYWNKAALYMLMALPPIAFNFTFTSFFACGLIFCTGVVYGMMALGKKATVEEMRSSAVTEQNAANPQQKPNSMQSNLVANAQPIGVSGPPMYDSNV